MTTTKRRLSAKRRAEIWAEIVAVAPLEADRTEYSQPGEQLVLDDEAVAELRRIWRGAR